MELNYYFAYRAGERIQVTPWPMISNEGGFQELTGEQRGFPHYRAVVDDAEAFFRTAGESGGVALYNVQRISLNSPAMVGSLWFKGPLGPTSMSAV